MSGEVAQGDEAQEEDAVLATLALPAGAEAVRLDRFLVARLGELVSGTRPLPEDVPADARLDVSRAEVQRWIEDGRVRIGLRPLKKASEVRPGDVVLVDLPPPVPPPGPLEPEALPIAILHQDEAVLVLDKPAGMPVHPGPGRRAGTLANALLAASAGRLSSLGGADRPGIVHRLDMDTTGVIVVARTDHAHRHLVSQFQARTVAKEYLALVEGVPADDGTVDAPIGRHPRDRKRMAVVRQGGRSARSHWRVLERFERRRLAVALVSVKIETGRTHQIRVHLSSIGHPVVADATYGRRGVLTEHEARGDADPGGEVLIARQALHAARLAFDHPVTGARLELRSPLPADFERALLALRA